MRKRPSLHSPIARETSQLDLGSDLGLIGAPAAATGGRRLLEDLDIRIDQEGRWFYHGSPIQRKELICLFASALTRDSAGGYWLVTPTEMGPVQVDDAPFLAVEMFTSGVGRDASISFRTNVDEIVTVNHSHPLYVRSIPGRGEVHPYLGLDRALKAKLTRPVYYELVELGGIDTSDGESEYGVWSCGCFFPLGRPKQGS